MKTFLVLVLLAALGAVLWFFLGSGPEQKTTEQVQERTILEVVRSEPGVQTANLAAVDQSASEGTAWRLVKEGTLLHAVEAAMGPPAQGNVYEGWLVQTSPLEFFSTGVMEQRDDGTWTLEYEAQEERPTFLRVVITEETVVDETPERHVIEGDFQ